MTLLRDLMDYCDPGVCHTASQHAPRKKKYIIGPSVVTHQFSCICNFCNHGNKDEALQVYFRRERENSKKKNHAV